MLIMMIHPQAKPSCGSFWWRDVFSLMDIYHGITTCIPAAGDTILLWKDVWRDERPLMDTHEHLFSYTKNEDISLAQYYNDIGHEDNFLLPLSMEARSELGNLQEIMEGINLEAMGTDEWILCWGDVDFKPQKFYKYMFRNVLTPTCITSIWKSKCIMRHKVFAWLMLNDRVNTRDLLLRRHFNIGEDHNCLVCDMEVLERNTHLFYDYPFATKCWETVGIHWDNQLDMQHKYDRARTRWQGPLFKEVTVLTQCNIWKQRNRMVFDGEVATHIEWLRKIKEDFVILGFKVSPKKLSFLEGFSNSLSV